MGATHFVCALYNGESHPLYKEISGYKSLYNLQIRTSVNCAIDQYNGAATAPGLNKIRMEFAPKFGWYCIADLDEFCYFGGKTIPGVIKEAAERSCDAVHGVFFDRIAADGSFPEIEGSLDETFPLACELTRYCGPCCQKIVIAKVHVEIDGGHHSAKGAKNVWANAAEVHHFKWSRTILEVVQDKYRRAKAQRRPWAEKQAPMLLNILKDKIDINNPHLNVRKAVLLGI
jgi:hypothetical protein